MLRLLLVGLLVACALPLASPVAAAEECSQDGIVDVDTHCDYRVDHCIVWVDGPASLCMTEGARVVVVWPPG